MKKIVGIMAAVACLATSVFAADVSAAVQGFGNFLNFSTAKDSKLQLIGWNDPWDREFSWYSTGIGFSFNGDRAGLSFELDKRDVTVKNSKFYIQPLDFLKVTLGNNTMELAKETIDYAGTVFTTGFEGFVLTLTPVTGLTAEIGLPTGQNGNWATYYWFNGEVSQLVASVAYSADFGTVKAIYDLDNKKNTIGVDYVGNFGATMVSPAVAFVVEDKKLAADVYVTTNAAGVGINLYTKVDVPVETAKDTAVAVNTKFSYGTSIGNVSLQLKDNNVLAKDFAMMAKVNLDKNCGSAGLSIGVQADIAKDVTISVPFQYNIHF